MSILRFKLYLTSGFITPFKSDTVFGHLCWALLYQEGQEALNELLKMCLEGRPPFVLSNAYPGDLLPRPLVAIESGGEDGILNPKDALKRSKRGKAFKDLRYITFTQFDRLRQGKGFELEDNKKINVLFTADVVHNIVNRLSGTTGENGLYIEEETFLNSRECPYLSLYAWCEPKWQDKLRDLLTFIGKKGFGKRHSVGKGRFDVDGPDDFTQIFKLDKPNAFISLSDFIPARDDPTEGMFQLFTKYGKLGEEYAVSGQPFKRPLLMIQAGSIFKTDHIKPFYGRAVESVAYINPRIIHPAFALAVPARVEI